MKQSYIVLGEMVNASLVIMPAGLLVIDTGGNAQEAGDLAAEAQQHGDVLYVLNTHEHGDHLAGNHLYNCPIISSAPARQQMSLNSVQALPSITFSEQMELFLGEPVLLKHFGGHCPGAAVVYFPQRRLLFTGDLIFAGRVPYMGQANFRRWLDALSALESWDVEIVVPGHGAQGGKELLSQQRQWLEKYIEDILDWSQQGQSQKEIFQHVLSRHQVVERWYPMITKSIELVISEFK